jgi:ABC-type multidrug transport system fused ATPase/permease subunit
MMSRAFVGGPATAVTQAVSLLNFQERIALIGIVFLRIFVTALDLAGIALVGVVVAIVSGTRIGPDSLVGTALGYLSNIGFKNGYAVLSVVAVGFFLIKGLVSIWLNYVTARYLADIESSRTTLLFDYLLKGDLAAADGLARTEILYGLTHSTNIIFSQTLSIATTLVGEFALLLTISIYLAITNLFLFVVIALFFGFIGAGMQYFLGSRAVKIGQEAQRTLMDAQTTAMGSLENFRQLRVSGNANLFVERFALARKSLARQNALNLILVGLPRYITEIAVMLGVGFLILLRSNDAGISVGAPTVAVFLVGIFRIVASMLPIQSGLTALSKNRAETLLGYELISRVGNFPEPNTPGARVGTEYLISVEALKFRYPLAKTPVFTDLEFHVSKGEFVAITGRSGAGKSTLADLLLGVRTPATGIIMIGGMTVEDYLSTHPGAIGYVPQRVNLLDDSLRENLLLGRRDKSLYSDEKLISTLEKLDLSTLLASMPSGLDTIIGENGVEMSGGQIQRIGLARALLSDPEILILDESTSALDESTAQLITDLINRLKGETTLIVIAHHEATIRAATRVLSLRSGRLTLDRA